MTWMPLLSAIRQVRFPGWTHFPLRGDQFISDKEKKDWLISQFAGYCTEMEGAAIAQAAYLNGVPFLIIRAISDKADDSAHEDYPAFEAKAITHCVNLTTAILQDDRIK